MFQPFIDDYCFCTPEEVATFVKWVVDSPKHIQIRYLSFNTGNSTIAVRRDRTYETRAVEADGISYGSESGTQTWDGEEK